MHRRTHEHCRASCLEDVATRVICANQAPDHHSIARFRQRRRTALGAVRRGARARCRGRFGDGRGDRDRRHERARKRFQRATRDHEQIAREILQEADRVDADEDAQFGEKRGEELPPELATAQGRKDRLREAKRRLDDKRAEEAADSTIAPAAAESETELARAGSAPRRGCSRTPLYWYHVQMEAIVSRGTVVLIPPDAGKRKGERLGWQGGVYVFMRSVLDREHGGGLYHQGGVTGADRSVRGRLDLVLFRGLPRVGGSARSAGGAERIWIHTDRRCPSACLDGSDCLCGRSCSRRSMGPFRWSCPGTAGATAGGATEPAQRDEPGRTRARLRGSRADQLGARRSLRGGARQELGDQLRPGSPSTC
jgi:hypothetical protein